jgi:4-hydroxy-4-methyl-2-oxoglutarate aldolase
VRDVKDIPGYNAALGIYGVVNNCPKGEVLIISGIHETLRIGANLMTRASNKGIKGVVVEACNRDAAEIRNLPMPVFSQGVAIKMVPPNLKIAFEEKLPIDFGGAKIYPGDIILGDNDGVIVIPKERLDDVIYQLEMIAEVEREASAANRDKPDMSVEDYTAIIAKKKKLRP